MSTATTAIVAANAATVAANAARHRQAVAACQANVAAFEPAGATVEQKRYYAQCVQLLYPAPDQPMPAGLEIALKAAIVLAIFGAIVPWFRSSPGDGWGEKLFLSFLGAILTPCCAAFVVGLVMGARWVLFG